MLKGGVDLYALFLAQITAKTATFNAGTATVINSGGSFTSRSSLTSPGIMTGTSWGSYFHSYAPTNYSGMARHLFPDEATWAAGLAAGDQVYAYISYNGSSPNSLSGLNRNGLNSASHENVDDTPYDGAIVREFVYFDRVLAKARVVLNPYSAGLRSVADFTGSFAN